ncbi:MAG TPA: TetR/AcrR family transcriptional regulator [Ktedonobacteraceae bacterium]|nr:TetR/AcrR family transcriptional regulator [Ktedonobacteraceae bacterium]
MTRKRIPRRQRLIEIGMELFWDRSYEEVAIDDIARAADISKGLLYYYFPTKHDFYAAVVQHAAEQLLQETEPDPALEPTERLRASLNAYFAYVKRHAKAYVALLRGGVGMDTQIAGIMDAVRQTYIQRLIQHVPGATTFSPLQLLALNGWVGFVEAISIAWLEQQNIEQEELCNLAVTAFITVLRGNKRGLLSH